MVIFAQLRKFTKNLESYTYNDWVLWYINYINVAVFKKNKYFSFLIVILKGNVCSFILCLEFLIDNFFRMATILTNFYSKSFCAQFRFLNYDFKNY